MITYVLEGPEIESWWAPGLPHLTRPALCPPSLVCHWPRVSFPGVKRPPRDVNHPHPSSAEVKERVELKLYSTSGPSLPFLECVLSLHLTFTVIINSKTLIIIIIIIIISSSSSSSCFVCGYLCSFVMLLFCLLFVLQLFYQQINTK